MLIVLLERSQRGCEEISSKLNIQKYNSFNKDSTCIALLTLLKQSQVFGTYRYR